MARYDIGPKIGIEGEKEFRKAITDINTNMRTLGTEMQAVASQFDKNDKSTQSYVAKNEVLNKQIDAQKNKLSELQKGLAASSDKYGENDRVTQGWQQSVNKATADLNKMERELKENESALDGTTKELNDAGEAAEKSGERFAKLGTALKASAVAIGAVAVAAGAAAIKMGIEVVQQFGELEQNLGGSEAVFGEYAASIQKAGEEAYKNLGVSQSEYLATANKMGALFQGSGIEQQKSLELTEQAMQRAADMASVMGIDMQVALDSVAGAAKGNFTMMDNLGVAMNATNIEAYALANGLDFTWKTATQAEKAEVAMQMFFENTQQYAGNFAMESTQTVTGSIGLLQAALGSFTAGLGNANADMTNLTGNLVDAFNAVVDNIAPIIQNLTNALPAAFAAILPAIGNLLPSLLIVVADLFKQVLGTALNLLPQLIPVAVGAVMTIVDTLIDNLPLIIDSAFTLVMSLSEGLIEALPELIPQSVAMIMTIVEGLLDNIDQLIDAGIGLIMSLADGLIEAIPVLVEKIPVIIEKIILALSNNMPKLLDAGVKIVLALADGIIKAIPDLLKAVPHLMSVYIQAFMDYIPELWEVGKNLIIGLWNGMASLDEWIKEKVREFVTGIGTTIKKFFGIESPSKLMAEYGRFIAEGLAQGIEENAKKPEDATMVMANVVGNAFKKVQDTATSTVNLIKSKFELWSLQNRELEGTVDGLNMKLKTQQDQLPILADKVAAAKQALNDIIYEYGEGSAEADKYTQSLISAQIEHAKMQAEIGNTITAIENESKAMAEQNKIKQNKLTNYKYSYASAFGEYIKTGQVLKDFGYNDQQVMDWAMDRANEKADPTGELRGGDTTINIYNPQPDPIETGRQIKKASRDLALGV